MSNEICDNDCGTVSYNLKCLQMSDCFELISFNWSLDLNSVPSNEIWLIYIHQR